MANSLIRALKKRPIFELFLVGGIVLLFVITRLYNISHRINFDWDQERDVQQIWALFVDHKPTLIGPRVVGTGGFFLGPYFTYLLAPFYLLSGLHPYGMILFIAAYTIIFATATYFVIRKLFSRTTASLFLLLWAINPLLIDYETTSWNPILIPLGISLVWYLLYLLTKKESLGKVLLLGFINGIFLNLHFQFIFITLFSIIFLFLNQQKKITVFIKHMILFLVGISVTLLPLLLFDIRHDFLNTKLFLSFFVKDQTVRVTGPFSWIPVLTNLFQPLLIIKSPILTLGLYSLAAILFIILIKRSGGFIRKFFISSFVMWIAYILVFMMYGKRPSEYYFLFVYPFLYIAFSEIMTRTFPRALMALVILVIFIMNASALQQRLSDNSFGLFYKDLVVQNLSKITQGRQFNVSLNIPPGRNAGYPYLLDYYRVKQSGNNNDPLVEIDVPLQHSDIPFGNIGLKIPSELQ